MLILLEEIYTNHDVEESPRGVGESRVFVNSVNDLPNFEELVIKAYDLVNY